VYDDKAVSVTDRNAMYDGDVVSGITIGPTSARLGQQRQQNNGKDTSPTTPVQ
jgi:hypothetical protein